MLPRCFVDWTIFVSLRVLRGAALTARDAPLRVDCPLVRSMRRRVTRV